jgi:hypothetical protein
MLSDVHLVSRRRPVKRIAFALGIVLVVAACGGDSEENEASDAATVSSSDGKAELTLAAGSLPEGISAEDLQIEWAVGSSTEPGAPAVGVRLEPDGLILNEPASLRLELPDTVGDQFAVVHVSGDGFEFTDGEVEVAESRSFLVTSINHFSKIAVYNVEGLTTTNTSADPSVVGVGQSQLLKWEVWLEPISFGLWIPTDSDGDKSQLWTFDEGQLSDKPSQFTGRADWLVDGGVSWDPLLAFPSPVLDDVLASFAASSTCTKVNSIDPWVETRITFSTTVKSKGEVVDTEFLRLAESLGQPAPVGKSAEYEAGEFEGGETIPFDAKIGQEVEAGLFVREIVESECVASAEDSTTSSTSSTTSSTSSTTSSTTTTAPPTSPVPPGLDPRAHVTGITPVATPNSTIGLNATFAQPWGPVPPDDLFSFFVLFNILQGNLSLAAGWEVHNQTVTPLGPGPTYLLEDGSILIDTGFPLGPGTPINVTGENGSWPDEATTQPVFGEFMFPVDPSEPLEPIDMDTAVFDLVTQTPLP